MTALKLIHSQDGLIMKHIHIIGIGGTFMGGVAAIAKEAGFKVSGCDAKMYPPMRKPGASPAYSKTHASMDAVVVLPCVPATPSTQ